MDNQKHEIEIQLPDVSFGEIQAFAERFGCTAVKTKNRFYYKIKTDDVINFYWLGCNMNNGMLNKLGLAGSLSKFVEP